MRNSQYGKMFNVLRWITIAWARFKQNYVPYTCSKQRAAYHAIDKRGYNIMILHSPVIYGVFVPYVRKITT